MKKDIEVDDKASTVSSASSNSSGRNRESRWEKAEAPEPTTPHIAGQKRKSALDEIMQVVPLIYLHIVIGASLYF